MATLDAKQKKSRFEKVSYACAIAEEDEFGTFAIKDIVEPYNRMADEKVKSHNIAYNVQKLCESEKGSILARVGDSTKLTLLLVHPMRKVFNLMMLVMGSGLWRDRMGPNG